MAKVSRHIEIPLRAPPAGELLSRWLYRELREAILSGALKPGLRLPSSRDLARQHRVSRGTVNGVFEQLISEGYLVSRVGAGSYVNQHLPDQFFQSRPANRLKAAQTNTGRIAQRARTFRQSPFPLTTPSRMVRAFRANEPSVTEFPTDVWARLASRRWRLASSDLLRSGDTMGYRPLREAIAAHLGATRGVVCDAEQVMIVSGTQQALSLTAHLTTDAGDAAWLEEPGYPGAAAVLRAANINIITVPVDDRGMNVAAGIRKAPKARLAYVTPAHQYPLGVTMTLERRLELLNWSRQSGAWIFEDDYDSEFRFAGRPLAAMQGLVPATNVIFSGSFSKMLFPSLRLGFLVCPAPLIEPIRAARSVLDRFATTLDQAVLCDFMVEGHFGHHLRRMREVYAERLEELMKAAESEWGDRLRITRTDSGLQTIGWLARGLKDTDIAQAAEAEGIEVIPLSAYALKWRQHDGLQLGFGAVPVAELKRGVKVLAKLLR